MTRYLYVLLTFLSILHCSLSKDTASLRGSEETRELEANSLSVSTDNHTRVDSIRKLIPTSDKKHDTNGLHPIADKTDVELFHELAKSLPPPVTDKVEMHKYAEMYGTFLLPVKRLIEKGQLTGVKTVTGDQGSKEVLQRWIKETGGQFDIIIDDGGHHNDQIYDSFMNLWPELKPGGLYFIEDLQVGRTADYADKSKRGIVMADVIYSWIEQLLINDNKSEKIIHGYPIPKDIRLISCQKDACVISKCDGKFGKHCSQ